MKNTVLNKYNMVTQEVVNKRYEEIIDNYITDAEAMQKIKLYQIQDLVTKEIREFNIQKIEKEDEEYDRTNREQKHFDKYRKLFRK